MKGWQARFGREGCHFRNPGVGSYLSAVNMSTCIFHFDNGCDITCAHCSQFIEYRSDDVTKNFFLDFSILDTMYRWSMMKNIHSPNWVGIGS